MSDQDTEAERERLAAVLQAFAAERLELALELPVATRLVEFMQAVHARSQLVNLIGPGSVEEGVLRHLIDSLALARHFAGRAVPPRLRVLDFGTGGGFPGVVLGLWQPGWRIVLNDARKKKLTAIEDLLSPEERTRFRFAHGRYADIAVDDPSLRAQFDLVTSRAVSKLGDVIAETGRALAPGGALVVWKSARLDAAERLGGEQAAAYSYPPLEVLDELSYDAAFEGRLLRFRRVD